MRVFNQPNMTERRNSSRTKSPVTGSPKLLEAPPTTHNSDENPKSVHTNTFPIAIVSQENIGEAAEPMKRKIEKPKERMKRLDSPMDLKAVHYIIPSDLDPLSEHRLSADPPFDSPLDVRVRRSPSLGMRQHDRRPATPAVPVKKMSCKLQQTINHFGIVTAVAFSPTGRKVVFGSAHGTIRILDRVTEIETLRLKGDMRIIKGITFSPDGQKIAVRSSLSDDTISAVLDQPRHCLQLLGTKKRVVIWEIKTKPLDCVAFSPTGDTIACNERHGYLYLFNATTGKRLRKLSTDKMLSGLLQFSLDGLSILVAKKRHGSEFSMLQVLDVATGRSLARYAYPSPELERGTSKCAIQAGFLPDGQGIWFCSSERVELWNFKTNASIAVIQLPHRTKFIIAASLDGHIFTWNDRHAEASKRLCIYQVDLAAGNIVQSTMVDLKHRAKILTVSPDGRNIISVSFNSVCVWRLE